MTVYLDEVIRPLDLIFPKMSGFVKAFKIKIDKNKNRNNKMMSFRRDNDKHDKYKSIWIKVEDLKNIEWEHMGISMKNLSLF